MVNARYPRVAVSPKPGGVPKEQNDKGERDDEDEGELGGSGRAGPSSANKVGERRRELKDEAAATTRTTRMKRKRSLDDSSDLGERYVSLSPIFFSSSSALQRYKHLSLTCCFSRTPKVGQENHRTAESRFHPTRHDRHSRACLEDRSRQEAAAAMEEHGGRPPAVCATCRLGISVGNVPGGQLLRRSPDGGTQRLAHPTATEHAAAPPHERHLDGSCATERLGSREMDGFSERRRQQRVSRGLHVHLSCYDDGGAVSSR